MNAGEPTFERSVGTNGRTTTVGADTSIEIVPVHGRFGRNGRNRFVDIPFRVNAGDPHWIPPLRLSVHDRISPKYPGNIHQTNALWLAYRDGKPVGRIGACVDSLFNEFQNESWLWVGFFDAFDDQAVANALFEAAWDWGRAHGAETAIGPASFTTNDELGLLVENFDDPPLIMTTENPKYYERLWLAGGWAPTMDLWGWKFTREGTTLTDRQRKVLQRLRQRAGLRIRGVNMKDFDAEVDRLFQVYSAGWQRNWGFAPMTEGEVRHLAKQLKQIADPELALIVEKEDGTPIGVALTLPDANEPMRKVRSGRLFPTGWYHLLTGMKKVSAARVWALGVIPEQQNLALGALLYGELFDRMSAKTNIVTAEASWILATNDRMNKPLESMGGQRYKTWRMYEHPLR